MQFAAESDATYAAGGTGLSGLLKSLQDDTLKLNGLGAERLSVAQRPPTEAG